jgi:phospho-N-acetylmuramoyl-pentapeptide-transferase
VNRYWKRGRFRVTTECCNGKPVEEKSTATTIPFFKNNEFDYAELLA